MLFEYILGGIVFLIYCLIVIGLIKGQMDEGW